MATMQRPYKNIDEYIGLFPPEVQRILQQLRETIQEAAPEAAEAISYGIPTFKLNGNLVHFAAYKKHIGFYPTPSAIAAFTKELSLYKQSKGAVQFPINQPIPFYLVSKMVEYKVNETRLSFPVKKEYARCVDLLRCTGILTHLPKSGSFGVIGIDGEEYPIPTQEQIEELFALQSELVSRKVPQGFDHLELTPIAMPAPLLIKRMKAAILRHSAEGKIYRTWRSPYDLLNPVHVDTEKTVWLWDTLGQALDTEQLVYFPQEYSSNHRGQSKWEVVHNGRICAAPGWSVGLVESLPMIPQQGQGKTLAGRRQLETGSSPRDYLRTLQTETYQGETGKTLEDFIIEFIARLEATGEVSHDRHDDNALWLLGQYVKYVEQVKSDLVPTEWWHRDYGRVRLDAHRPGNKLCTSSWGVSTTVRLGKLIG